MDTPPQSLLRFGTFELDLSAHQLRDAGRPVHIERRPMELLVLLVRRRGQLVTREEIIEKLWGGKVVIDFDTGLNTLVRKVRQALGDSSEQPVFVETVTGKGYRFIAAIETAAAASDATVGAASQRPRSRPRWTTFALASLLLALAAIGLWRAASIGSDRITVAVLPFDDLSSDGAYDYLAAGLAEDTIASLGQIDPTDLQVIGPTSVRAYQRSGRPLSEVGNELGADYLVHSTLRVEGAQMRVTSSLIRTRDQVQLWNAAFDRELTSALGLQRDLSAAIARQVKIRVSPQRADEVAQRQTRDPAAYDFYLRGRHAWMQLTAAGNRAAMEQYERAIERDPGYALAWAGVSYALSASPMNSDQAPAAIIGRARAAADRALAAAPSLSEALLVRGYVGFWLERDWEAAERNMRRAVERDPNSALAHLLLAHLLSQKAEHVEARTLARRSRELDPLFPFTYAISSQIAFQARDYGSAIEYARQAIAMNPEFWIGYVQLGQALERQGDFVGALQAFADAQRHSGGNSKAIALRGYTLARMGRRADALATVRELEGIAASRYLPPYALALVQLGLGDIDGALAKLDDALAAGDVHLNFLTTDPKWDPLRGDPRFAALLERCGFR